MSSTILIVDDDPSGRATLEAILEGQGYTLLMAENGPTALEMAAIMHPDLILLDIMMPGMDGFEVCRRIRKTPELAEAPIIILTALDDNSSRLTGIEAGADDFLTKPVDRQELRSRVRTIIRLNRYRTLLEQRENLRSMAQRIVNAQEEERLRISRELHDDIGQSLTAHLISLRLLSSDLPLQVNPLRQRLNNLIVDTIETLNRMRQLAEELRPPSIDTLDLATALGNCCGEFSKRSRLPVEYEAATIPSISDVTAITLYRFLQETLTNVLKHAEATRVWVELSQEEGSILLTVQDNGKGFTKENADRKGIGMQGLHERVTIAGGKLTVRSTPGRGTVVVAHLPLPSQEGRA
jgi:signal transduction histidine kinase